MSPEEREPPRIRRMLPSVSEVLKELTARAPVEPDVAFRAAREVCAEELKRIRDAGGDSVPLEELVQRALLRVSGGRRPAMPDPPPAPQPPAPAPPLTAEVFEEGPEPSFVLGPEAADEPFSETTGAMDLRWDPEPHEPFADAGAAGPLLSDAATAPELPPVPPGPVGLRPGAAAGAPVPFALPAEADVFGESVPGGEAPTAILPPEPEPEKGPGDETLTRLSREAQSIDLQSVFPRSSPVVPARPEPPGPAEERPDVEPFPPPFEDDEDTVLTIPRGGRRRAKEGGPRIGLLVGVAASLVALAGLGYLLVGLWVEREDAPPPVAVARPRPQATPAPLATPVSVPSPEAVESPDAVPAAAPVPVVPPAPAATAAPAPAVTAAPTPAPPEPVQVKALEAGPAPAATAPRTRDGLVVTKDRDGQPLAFSIHFTSYRDRASAERDLKRIEGLVGREGFVAEVDLGEKGVWHRVMIGAFPTAQEARAVREELAAKGTRDMGWVYRVIGPEAPDPR